MIEMVVPQLRSKWKDLWRESGATGDPEPSFMRIINHYSEPHRKYHTLDHVFNCLDEYEGLKRNIIHEKGYFIESPALKYALWFHDVIYISEFSGNEEESADLAREILSQAGLPPTLVHQTEKLIMVTKGHKPTEDLEEQIMVDIDLSILGADQDTYENYKKAIRQEYKHIPTYLFRKGRARVLESFQQRVERNQLFSTPFFKSKYNEQAGINLRQEQGQLESMKVAIYAGSFDPPTNGHLYVIDRATTLFDDLVIAIGHNPEKPTGRFSLEERLEMLKEVTSGYENVDVTSFPTKYLINFAKDSGADFIVRGLRGVEDWGNESAMDEFNYGVNPKVTTIFLRTPDHLARISSSFVMGLIGYEGWQKAVKSRVPKPVFKRIVATRS